MYYVLEYVIQISMVNVLFFGCRSSMEFCNTIHESYYKIEWPLFVILEISKIDIWKQFDIDCITFRADQVI